MALSSVPILAALVLREHLVQTPYFLFIPGPMIAAWYGGRTAGLLTALIALLAVDYFIVPPVGGLIPVRWADAVVLAAFSVVVVGVVLVTAARRRADVERAEALRAAEAAWCQAQRTTLLKDQFLATLSHELRTPLNAILGWTSVLVSGRLDPSRASDALVRIHRNAVAQKQSLDDLLDTSALLSGGLRVEREMLDLGEVARSALESFRESIALRGPRIVEHLVSVRVQGDARRLRQVINNLLLNAVKFTPEGGSVELRVAARDGFATITVTDTGRGIAADFLPHVFTPFRQADTSVTRISGGLGLGLALVRHLVEAHGGFVSAASDGVGHGATFIVSLPIGLTAQGEDADARAGF